MKRNSIVPVYASAVIRGPAPLLQPGRVPHGFKEAMKRVGVTSNEYQTLQTPGVDSETPVQPSSAKSAPKWKSSFKPIGDPDSSPQDRCPDSPERTELYDPYNPVSPDSEREASRGQDHDGSPFKRQDNPESQTGTRSRSRWDIPAPATARRPPTRENRLNPGHRLPEQASNLSSGAFDPPGYCSIGRPLGRRVGSPDGHILGTLDKKFPGSYGPRRTSEDERIIPDYRAEVTATARPSPPRSKRNAQEMGYFQTGMDEIPSRSKRLVMERIPVMCDLCDVELLDCQELRDHLESRAHWNTMEHIQQENDYNDLAVAFLQEVMLHKSRRFSRPVEDSVLEVLQENDHMTKVEVFHCAVCETFISSSASSVHAHVTSQEHLDSIQRFGGLQRAASLDRAQAMMEELKPQFQHFLKGGNPFE